MQFVTKSFSQLDCSIHQCVCAAIRDSQQAISPIGFLFLKLPLPPCAVLLVMTQSDIKCTNRMAFIAFIAFMLFIVQPFRCGQALSTAHTLLLSCERLSCLPKRHYIEDSHALHVAIRTSSANHPRVLHHKNTSRDAPMVEKLHHRSGSTK